MRFVSSADEINSWELPGKTVEITVSSPSYSTGIKENADIEILTEKNPLYMFDIVKVVQGKEFRSYENIESMEVNLEYKHLDFLVNIVNNYSYLSVFKILELIKKAWSNMETDFCICKDKMYNGRDHLRNPAPSRLLLPIFYNNSTIYAETNICEDNRGNGEIIFKPSNKGGPTFVEDHFKQSHEKDRTNNFEDYIKDKMVLRFLGRYYMRSGFPDSNFKLGCYPTIDGILTGRFDDRNSGLTVKELKKHELSILQRFEEWYDGDVIGDWFFKVDENENKIIDLKHLIIKWKSDILSTFKIRIKEVKQTTPLHDVWPKTIYDSNKALIYEMFGTPDKDGNFPYSKGTTESETNNNYAYLFDDTKENKNIGQIETYIQNKDSNIEIWNEKYLSIKPTTAYQSIFYNNGKIGDRRVFEHGIGKEWYLFEQYRKFLKRKKMSSKEFVMHFPSLLKTFIHSDPVKLPHEYIIAEQKVPCFLDRQCPNPFGGTFGAMIKDAMHTVEMDPKDIVEFYDEDHPAPMDDISAYIAIPMGGSVTFTKKRRDEDADGNVVITTVTDKGRTEEGTPFKIDFNKNEFISSIRMSGLKYFVSNFMELKIKIKFKEKPVSYEDESLRIFTDDLTIPVKRTFEIVNDL